MKEVFQRHIIRERRRKNPTGAKALTGLLETFNALVETGLVEELPPIGGSEPNVLDPKNYGSMRLSQILSEAMKAQHLTQSILARRAGVSQSLISNLLNDSPRNISAITVHQLSVALGVGVTELIDATLVSRMQSNNTKS